ncbi:MAG: hypothetical protein LBO67_09200 [Spirochaetaceae bacterium]|jgi:hypothetical protein|nr:hypothetical protein [Spirochaetaceae bacterium]
MASHELPRGLTDQGLTYHVTSKVNQDAFEVEPDEMKELFLIVIELGGVFKSRGR